MNIYAIPPLTSALLFIILGLFVFLRNIKSRTNQAFGLMCLVTFWWQFCWFMLFNFGTDELAKVMVRVGYTGIIFIPLTFYHFFIVFLKRHKEKIFVLSAYLLGIFFLFFNWTSGLFIKGYYKYAWGYYPKAGFLHPAYLLLLFSIAARITYILYQELCATKSFPFRYNQIKYILTAFIIYTCASLDFAMNYGLEIYPIGFVFISLSLGIMAYTISKYHLMHITIFALRGLILGVVYALVLGVPFGVMIWARSFIEHFGYYGMLIPLLLGMSLASVGPFIYQSLRKRAEAIMLREQHRYQKVLRELSHTMIRIKDIDNLLKTVAVTITETVKVSFIAIYLKDEEYKYYRRKHYYPKESLERFKEFIPLDDPLPKALIKEKIPLSSEEIGSYDKISLDSGLVIPCIVENNLSAFIVLGAKPNKQMYTPDDILAFETVSYSVSLAIENCLYWREIEEYQRNARMREMDIFSYSVAHEIDNPMTSIKTCVAYLKDVWLKDVNLPQDKKEDLIDTIDTIAYEQDRTSATVKAVEDYGKKVPTSKLMPIRLKDVIDDFFKVYLFEFKHHGIYFTQEVPENLPYLMGVKQLLVQILVNFSANAIHACLGTIEGQKKIYFKVELPNPDWVRISIRDNGYGIAEDRLRVIFAPLATSKASSEGKGMGLYIVRKTIERHNGRVWAESEGKDKGSTFFMELPIAKDVTEEDVKKQEASNIIIFGKDK